MDRHDFSTGDYAGPESDPVDHTAKKGGPKRDSTHFQGVDGYPRLFSSNPLEGESLAETLQRVSALLLTFRVDIEKALVYAYGSYTFDDVVAGVMRGRFTFYTLGNSFAFCELEQAPQYSYFHCFLAGGKMHEIKHMLDVYAPDVAKSMGAKYLCIRGREGWARALEKEGWEPRYTTLYKEV